MKQSIGKMFLKGFIQSFFIVAILLSMGIVGYKLTIHYWQAPDEDAVVAYQEETVPEHVTEASVDDVSKNLIYCYDEETKEITKIVLEIFHCDNKQITYITIPMRTQLNLSETLYRKMVLVNPSFPQMMQLSTLTSYLDEDFVFDYGVLMLQDLLGIEISYYTVIPQNIYETIFTSKTLSTKEQGEATIDSDNDTLALPVEAFTDKYIAKLKKFKSQEDIEHYIKEIYPSLQSNLSLSDKLKYLESYYETPISNVSFELVKGKDTNMAFLVDRELFTSRYLELTKGK